MTTRRTTTLAALAWAALAGPAAPVVAQAQTPDPGPTRAPGAGTLIVTGEAGAVTGAGNSRTGSIEWLGHPSPRATINGGLVSFGLGDVGWTFGRAGGSLRIGSRGVVHAQVDAGRGRHGDASYPYAVVRGGATYQIGSRVAFELEEQYVHVEGAIGHVGKFGLGFRPTPSLSLAAAVTSSLGGALGVHAATVRADRPMRRGAVFGGLSIGIVRPELAGLGSAGPVRDTREVFAGTTIPVRPGRVTLALDVLWMPDVRRHSFLASWSLPL